MTKTPRRFRRAGTRAACALAVVTLLVATPIRFPIASPLPANAATVPWTGAQLMRTDDLAAMIRSGGGERPLLLHVGFRALYRAGAIPGSRYVGAGSRPEGIATLRLVVKGQRADRLIVLYCGCCPWEHCPNMGPAFRTLRELGFKNVRALYIPKNLETDWAGRGFPLETPRE